MQTELLKKSVKTVVQTGQAVTHASGQALALGVEAERLKARLSNRFEDSVIEARRALKRSRYAAEDLLDDTTRCVKQNPWSAVGLTLGLGFGLGALVGLLAGERLARTCARESKE